MWGGSVTGIVSLKSSSFSAQKFRFPVGKEFWWERISFPGKIWERPRKPTRTPQDSSSLSPLSHHSHHNNKTQSRKNCTRSQQCCAILHNNSARTQQGPATFHKNQQARSNILSLFLCPNQTTGGRPGTTPTPTDPVTGNVYPRRHPASTLPLSQLCLSFRWPILPLPLVFFCRLRPALVTSVRFPLPSVSFLLGLALQFGGTPCLPRPRTLCQVRLTHQGWTSMTSETPAT